MECVGLNTNCIERFDLTIKFRTASLITVGLVLVVGLPIAGCILIAIAFATTFLYRYVNRFLFTLYMQYRV